MSRALGFLFFLLFLAGLALVMLQNRVVSPPPANTAAAVQVPQNSIVAADWLAPGAIGEVGIGEVGSGKVDQRVFVRFRANGTISGFAGCNSFFGDYVATDRTLDVGPLRSTRKTCAESIMQQEAAVLQTIAAASAYRVNGNALILRHDARTLLTLHLGAKGSSQD